MEHAIYTDCHTLINKFVHNRNPRFESFCVQWKALMFQHTYSAQSSTTEVLQTTATALHVTKRILCQEHCDERELLQRIGALYLMYALYFKQPTKQFMKIDVTLNDWSKMRTLIEKLSTGNQDTNNLATDEPIYVFWKLYTENAFRFCAHDFDVGLENLVDYDKIQEKPTHFAMYGKTSTQRMHFLEDIEELPTTVSMLPALTTLEHSYNEMKDLLIKESSRNDDGRTLSKLALPDTNIFKDIQDVFKNIHEIFDEPSRKKRFRKKIPQQQQQEAENEKDNDDHHRDKRINLKRKCFQVIRTKEGLKIHSAPPRTDASDIMQLRGARRMSARTVFSEELPKETLEDLQGDGNDENSEDDVMQHKEFIPN